MCIHIFFIIEVWGTSLLYFEGFFSHIHVFCLRELSHQARDFGDATQSVNSVLQKPINAKVALRQRLTAAGNNQPSPAFVVYATNPGVQHDEKAILLFPRELLNDIQKL